MGETNDDKIGDYANMRIRKAHSEHVNKQS